MQIQNSIFFSSVCCICHCISSCYLLFVFYGLTGSTGATFRISMGYRRIFAACVSFCNHKHDVCDPYICNAYLWGHFCFANGAQFILCDGHTYEPACYCLYTLLWTPAGYLVLAYTMIACPTGAVYLEGMVASLFAIS